MGTDAGIYDRQAMQYLWLGRLHRLGDWSEFQNQWCSQEEILEVLFENRKNIEGHEEDIYWSLDSAIAFTESRPDGVFQIAWDNGGTAHDIEDSGNWGWIDEDYYYDCGMLLIYSMEKI